MKKLKIAFVIFTVLLVPIGSLIYAVNYFTSDKDYEIDYGSSQMYSQSEIYSAVKKVESKLNSFESVGDILSISYYSEGARNDDSEFEYYLTLKTSFRTNDIMQGFEQNTVCDFWKWYLGSNDGKSWEIVSYGAA